MDAAATVVAWCTCCPSWRVMRATRGQAQLAAAAHLELVHDDKKRAAKVRELAARKLHGDTP